MILSGGRVLGLLASVLGLMLGFALSLLLVFVVNEQESMTVRSVPRELLAGALLLVWCITVLAGLYPAGLPRLNPIDVIHEEVTPPHDKLKERTSSGKNPPKDDNQQPNIRNIAIIAHVDHGKTTLVDAMLNQSGIFGLA